MNRNSNCNFAVATGHVPVIHNQSLVDDSNVLIQRTCWADMHRNREQDIARMISLSGRRNQPHVFFIVTVLYGIWQLREKYTGTLRGICGDRFVANI